MNHLKLISIIICIGIYSANSFGQFLNSSFATNGYTQDLTSFGKGVEIVVQPDNKILVANQRKDYYTNTFNPDRYYLYCNRYNQDGSLDNTFGLNGVARIHHYNKSNVLAIDRQSNGKILLAGESKYCGNIACGWTNLVLGRLNSDGSVDPSFGINGVLEAEDILGSMYLGSSINTVKTLSSGKILISGIGTVSLDGTTSNFEYRPFIARLNDDGSFDTTFGPTNSGISYMTQFTITTVNDMLIADDGSIFWLTEDGDQSAVIKLSINGIVKINYGTGGAQTINIGTASNSFVSMDFREDDKLALGGYIYNSTQDTSIMVVLNSDGSMFSQVSQSIIDIPMNDGRINSIKCVSNNRILIAGTLVCDTSSFSNNAHLGFIGLVNEDGTFDPSFSTNGILTFNLAAQGNWNRTFIQDIQVLSNGDILCSGSRFATPGSTKGQVLLLSLNSDGTIENTNSITDLPSNITLAQVYPNPLSESSILSYFNKSNTTVSIKMYDLSGRQVASFFNGIPEIGMNQLSLNSAIHFDKGNYLIRIQSENTVKTISVKL